IYFYDFLQLILNNDGLGLIVPERDGNETVPEVVVTSGYALLHFFSDAAYNLTGFNITYNFDMCPNNCSGRGECKTSNSSGSVECECSENWKGDSCDIPYCINNCGFPHQGICNSSDEYDLERNTWSILQTQGALVQGGYGHSSVYDHRTKALYVHGGYKAFSANKYRLADDLYRYDVDTQKWTILKDSRFFRYLHTAVIVSGTMLVFGGNTHNDTSMSHGAKCFSSDFMAYDIACDRWSVLPRPNLHHDVNRFGHSAVLHNSVFFFLTLPCGILLCRYWYA
uniref:EGF-like domain-containing protein n=1 Tax=Spermophilus dauricus TaxID=99837 RepID=A0A8C9QUL9_SPEDA